MAEILAPMHLTAFEYRGRMVGGLSRPLLLACEDEGGREFPVVAKLRDVAVPGTTWGPASLACELICSVLARAAGLSVPDYAIIDVGAEFVDSVPDGDARHELSGNLGENFGSVYLEDCANYSPGMPVGHLGRRRLEGVLAFDAYVLNADRKAIKPNLIVRGDTIFLIDHSLSFAHLGSPQVPEPWNEWLPDDIVKAHCTYVTLKDSGPTFDEFIRFLGDELGDDDCRAILDLVPESWQRPSHEPTSQGGGITHRAGDKDAILRYILRRSAPYLEKEPSRLARVCGS